MDSSTELDALAEMNELDDFGNLFEFGEIDLNTIAESGQYGDPLQAQHGTHPSTPFQDMGETSSLHATSAHDFGGHEQYAISQSMEQAQYADPRKPRPSRSHPYVSEPMYQPSVSATYNPYTPTFQFQHQPGFPPNQHVPPTPNSYEMHGEAGSFLQQHPRMDPQQRAILEQRYQVRKDDALAFTPMVSPAGTPQYHMLPEYTTPGAYFSPLTSPMLLAQNQKQAQMLHQQQPHGYHTHPNTAPNSNTVSPIDPTLDVDMLDRIMLPESAGPRPRRSRRKIATPKGSSDGMRVKQSPAQNAQKRKSLSISSTVPVTSVETLLQRSVTSQPSSAGFQIPSQLDLSESDSISPEPLSESNMGPLPRPSSSLNQSPALMAQQHVGAAATPKSLLTIRGNQHAISDLQASMQANWQPWDPVGALDDLSLPEAASTHNGTKPSLSQIDTQLETSATYDGAPRLSARKTPKLGPLSTPTSARPDSTINSPITAESPMISRTPSAILAEKKDGKPGRSSKKRGNVGANGSTLVSPALIPKISPNIKPLLPEGTPLNTATQAMLLASKSNYQNLLEGNHLPGVTYPDSLSTGLTSKRTSHKVAEQGRRNRINDALKEMQALIPRSNSLKSPSLDIDVDGAGIDFAEEDSKILDANSSKEEASAKSSSSKAATVELANEYIKKMQKESASRDADLLQLKLENEALKKRLAEQSHTGSTPAESPRNGTESASASASASASSQGEEKAS